MEEGEKGRERNIEEHMHHRGFAVKFGFFGVRFELGSEGEEGEEQRGNGEKGWAGLPSRGRVVLVRTCRSCAWFGCGI